MRKDYEQHFVDCPHCSARQKFHRSLDVTLAVLTSLAVFFFLFALAVLKHIHRWSMWLSTSSVWMSPTPTTCWSRPASRDWSFR